VVGAALAAGAETAANAAVRARTESPVLVIIGVILVTGVNSRAN